MKHLTRKLLHLILAFAAMGVLTTGALAANTDTLTLTANPEDGAIVVSSTAATPFFVIPTITNASGATVTNEYSFSFIWLLNDTLVSTSNYYEFPAGMASTSYSLTCAVSATHSTDRTVKTAQVTWYPSVQNTYDITLTISESVGNFYFTGKETHSGTSVYDEIFSQMDFRNTMDINAYQISFIPNNSDVATFTGKPTCTFAEMSNVYLAIGRPGTWLTQYTVTYKDTVVLTGVLTIVIESHVGMDNFYTATPGESVVIPAADFQTFWAEAAGVRSTLQNVYITGCTGSGVSGVLCYDHTSTEKGHTSAYGIVMYATTQNTSQKALDDLTFVPVKSANKYSAGSVTITFTANGIDQNRNPISFSGSFVIFYTDTEVQTITYNCTGTYVMLSSADFDAVYRATTGTSTKDPIYTIRFLDLPTFGTLYRGYNAGNYGTLGSTPLTSSNLSTMTFSSRSTGENSLDKLAYVPVSHVSMGDSVRYIAYSGNQILYVGAISFTSEEFIVTYTTSGSSLKFFSTDFYTTNSPLLYAQYIMFGNPSSGTLYKDHANGIRVQSYDYFSYNATYGVNLLDNVVFVPKEGFTGVVEIPFSGNSLTGGIISGRVRIYVIRDDVFTDVDPDLWSAPYINRLYATGIISGTSATTFSPNDNMTYGAALKMVLIAAGYPKQSETGGSHWASNYLNLAYREGIVSSTKIDLNAPVNRETIAEIAAKALGLSKAGSVNAGISGPVDSSNGYVYALYNAGILNGSFDRNGYNYFYGDQYITRAEVAKIICMISDYDK